MHSHRSHPLILEHHHHSLTSTHSQLFVPDYLTCLLSLYNQHNAFDPGLLSLDRPAHFFRTATRSRLGFRFWVSEGRGLELQVEGYIRTAGSLESSVDHRRAASIKAENRESLFTRPDVERRTGLARELCWDNRKRNYHLWEGEMIDDS